MADQHVPIEAFGLAKSSVLRRFIRASAKELRHLRERRLNDVEWLVLVLDGAKGLRSAVRDEPDRECDGAIGSEGATGHALADERSEAALVRISALGGGATVSPDQEPRASALAEGGPAAHTLIHEHRRGVGRITAATPECQLGAGHSRQGAPLPGSVRGRRHADGRTRRSVTQKPRLRVASRYCITS